jgi:type VI protein secretion system component Hcp
MEKMYLFLGGISAEISQDPLNLKGIEISSFDFDISREVFFKDVTERLIPDHSHPEVSKIIITKPICPASPLIVKCLCLMKNQSFKLQIIHDKADGYGETGLSMLLESGTIEYESDICFIDSCRVISTGGHPMERISITVPKLEMTYKQNITNGITTSFGYNFQMSRMIE